MVWRPLLVCPADQHWEPKPNATLIGDAAHVMPPYAGEGVNMAMLDALVLSKFLLSEDTPGDAIAAYEAEMFSRMRSMTADTMVNTEMFYAPDACERVVALFRSFGGGEAAPASRRGLMRGPQKPAWSGASRSQAGREFQPSLEGKLTDAMEFSGCGTALVTPFRGDGGVDEPALVRLVNWQIESGIDFLVPCGTTGEASTLSEAEMLRVVEVVVGTVAGRVPVFAGCTHNSTREVVARAGRLAEVRGLTGLLSANPYYNRPGQEGQYLHFKAIAEATPLPVLLYNIPSRTGANLEPATVLRLAEIANVVGIKESSGSLVQITEILNNAPEGFKVFSGDDGLTLPVVALGGAGVISVASNAIPAEMARLVRAALGGDWGRLGR